MKLFYKINKSDQGVKINVLARKLETAVSRKLAQGLTRVKKAAHLKLKKSQNLDRLVQLVSGLLSRKSEVYTIFYHLKNSKHTGLGSLR